jgi:hypothetical protein
MKDFTRVCRIEPQAVGAWLKQTSVKSNFQHVVYTIFFRRPQKKETLIFGIPSNFKYYLTELRTKHTLVAMVTTTVCNDFIAHRLEGLANQFHWTRVRYLHAIANFQ